MGRITEIVRFVDALMVARRSRMRTCEVRGRRSRRHAVLVDADGIDQGEELRVDTWGTAANAGGMTWDWEARRLDASMLRPERAGVALRTARILARGSAPVLVLLWDGRARVTTGGRLVATPAW